MLRPAIELLKADLTRRLGIEKSNCYFIVDSEDPNLQRLSKICATGGGGGTISLAYHTKQGQLMELALKYNEDCFVFGHHIVTSLSSLRSLLNILKSIFESTSILKRGEHCWMLLLVLLKKFNIRGRKFESLHRIKRKTKPLSFLNVNPIFATFNNAATQMPTLDRMRLTSKILNRLNITEGNFNAVSPLLDSIIEIDIQKNQLLEAE